MIKIGGYDVAWCWHVFKTMLRIDLVQIRGTLVSKIIDRFVWTMSLMLVAAYLLPSFGMSTDFGKFLLVGLTASLGIIEAYSVIAQLIADLDGDRVITYYLTLPIPPALVFIRILVYYGLYFSVLNVLLFPMCNVFLPEPIAYASISWGRTIFMVLLANFFHAAMILWATTFIKDIRGLGQIWSRVLHPLWFFGGFQFTWAVVYEKSFFYACLALCNPLLYATEGLRAAVFGQAGYLPYWISASVLSCCIVVMTAHAIARFKRRLDLV
jgi:ABC-2 type transport system permease protein